MENDRAYYLRNMELAVLLSVKGVDRLYGMWMEDIRDSDQALVYRTLFELEKKKIISVCGNHLTIHPIISGMLEDMGNAGKALLHFGGTDRNCRQCIYLGSRAALLSRHGERGGMKRMQSIPLDMLAEKICEYGFYLKEMVSDESLFYDAELAKPELGERADGMFAKEPDEWERWEGMRECLRMVLTENGKCIRQYLLIREKLNDYIAVTDENGSHVYAYSLKKTMEILKEEWETEG